LTESDYCTEISKAVDDVLQNIGSTFKQVIYEDLARAGISFVHPCSSIEDIERALNRCFGPDGASLLIQAIRRRMDHK